MGRHVLLTEDAERDLEELHEYVATFDSPERAAKLPARLLDVTDGLAETAERGPMPSELRALGIHEYRQVFFKPYRVIYRIVDQRVVVYLIVDGRRDLQALLARRLLGG